MRDAPALLRSGFETLKADPVNLLVFTLVWFLLGTGGGASSAGHGTGLSVVFAPFDLLVGSVIVGGVTWAHLQAVRRQPISPPDAFHGFMSLERYVANVLSYLLVGLSVLFGLIFCVLPGIYVMVRLSMTTMLVNDRSMDAVTAMKESWRITAGQEMHIFIYFLCSFGLLILGVLACFVGIFPAASTIFAGFACLYEDIMAAGYESDRTRLAEPGVT